MKTVLQPLELVGLYIHTSLSIRTDEKRALTAVEMKAKVRATNWRTGKPSDNLSHKIDHIWKLNLMMKHFFGSVLLMEKTPSGTFTCADFDALFVVPGRKSADKPI